MKILHVIDHFSLGGAQRIVEGVLHALPESMLLALRKKGDPQDQIAMPENRILLAPRGSLLTQMLRLLRAPGIVAQNDFQIVHCHLPYSWLFGLWLYLVLPARNRPALVFHEHDSIKLKRWYYPLLARAAHRAGTLVAVSEYVQHQIASHGIPQENIRLLHNYIDLNRFSPGDPHALELPQPSEALAASRWVGFAGRLVAYKGWQYIIQAASRLRHKNIRFVIAGVGPDAGELERQIEAMNLQESVIPLGYVGQMVDFYRSIDILVIPSQREAFGLVQLEAQACGVPVILFESQAALELSGDQSTVIVPYGDMDALVEKIEHLLADPAAYARLVQQGLENARNYDLSAYLNKLDKMYTGMVAGKDRS
jgi:glycosyltransferase involved in cell wall biosynthesis